MTKKEPLLSICIPTYNREKYLKRLLDSIVSQKEFTDTDDVEIVVDDGPSTDNTETMVKEYIKKYGDKIKYFRNLVRIGMCPAFLEALNYGNGKYLWLFGSDDIMNEYSLKIVLKLLKENNPTCIIINGEDSIRDLQYFKFNGLNDFFTYLSISELKYGFKDGFFTFMTGCLLKRNYYNQSLNNLISNNIITKEKLLDNYFNFNLVKYSELYNNNLILFIKTPCLSLSLNGDNNTRKPKYKIIKDLNLLFIYMKKNYYVPYSVKIFFEKMIMYRSLGFFGTPIKKLFLYLKLNNLRDNLSGKLKKQF